MALTETISSIFLFFFFNDTATTEIYTLSLHDALPISITSESTLERVPSTICGVMSTPTIPATRPLKHRSEEHTSELQSLAYLVCRLLLEKKKKNKQIHSAFQKLHLSKKKNR